MSDARPTVPPAAKATTPAAAPATTPAAPAAAGPTPVAPTPAAPTPRSGLPPWTESMREIFRGGTTSAFVLHGDVFDLIPVTRDGATRFVSLSRFLTDVLFDPFDVVLFYDRGRGIRCANVAGKHLVPLIVGQGRRGR